MKKFFLIPLLACFSCVMAFAGVAHVSDIDALKAAIADASIETIYLDADIEYADETQGNQLNIARSLTIDGQGHTLSGYGKRTSSVYNIFSINNGGGSAMVDVVFKNLNMIITKATKSNDRLARVIETRGNIKSIELNNVTIGVADHTKTNAVGLQLGGSQASKAILIITNSTINVGNPGYPVLSWNPYEMTATNSVFAGYCGLYFKGVNGSTGSRGSIVNADACSFECPNVYSGATNAFSCFPMADDGITLNLHNCGINNKQIGDQNQAFLTTGNDGLGTNRHAQAINVNISGDNTHINVGGGLNETFQNLWGYGTNGYPNKNYNNFADINITITGGTYSVHPQSEDMSAYGHWIIEDDQITGVNLFVPNIPETHEVQEVKQGDVTLYRVAKKAATKEVVIIDEETGKKDTVEVLYDLNDLVVGEGEAEGNNPVSSFELSSGDTLELNNETTTAGYVQVQDNVEVDEETGEIISSTPTIIQVGKTETNEQTGEEEKVNQTLVINNGLDIQGESQVIVQSGSTLVVGEGGINTESADNIVIEASEGEEAVNFLLHPDITVNTTPMATYKFKSQAKGNTSTKKYTWQRFGVPSFDGNMTMTWEGNVGTALYYYDYTIDNWKNIEKSADHTFTIVGEPFACYNMTINRDDTTGIEYTFTGKLMGNTNAPLTFVKGWNYFANSYTAPIDIKTLIDEVYKEFGKGVEPTIYVYVRNNDMSTNWQSINNTYYLVTPVAQQITEIKPMQAFILYIRDHNTPGGDINYERNVYNPFMNIPNPEPELAPARVRSSNSYNAVVLSVSNGAQTENLTLLEDDDFSDEFDETYDATKLDNDNDFSFYCLFNESKFSVVATDKLQDKNLAFDSKIAGEFTLKVENAIGETIKLYDVVAQKLIELENGSEYKFTAEAVNNAQRFVVNPSDAPSAIDNTEIVVKATKFMGADGQIYILRGGNVYTVQGQNVK